MAITADVSIGPIRIDMLLLSKLLTGNESMSSESLKIAALMSEEKRSHATELWMDALQ